MGAVRRVMFTAPTAAGKPTATRARRTALPLLTSPSDTLPTDPRATLVGRVHDPDEGGPSVVAVRGDQLVDLFVAQPRDVRAHLARVLALDRSGAQQRVGMVSEWRWRASAGSGSPMRGWSSVANIRRCLSPVRSGSSARGSSDRWDTGPSPHAQHVVVGAR